MVRLRILGFRRRRSITSFWRLVDRVDATVVINLRSRWYNEAFLSRDRYPRRWQKCRGCAPLRGLVPTTFSFMRRRLWDQRSMDRSWNSTIVGNRTGIAPCYPPQPTARTLIPIDHAARSNSSSENSTLRDERPAIACAITTRYGYGMMAYQSLIDNNRLSEQSENPLSGVLAI